MLVKKSIVFDVDFCLTFGRMATRGICKEPTAFITIMVVNYLKNVRA